MDWKWIKSVWSEPDGTGSSARILNAMIISFILGIGTAFGVLTCNKHMTLDQFDNFLASGGTFIVTTCGPLYAANKAADWLKNRDNKNGGN